MTDISEEMKKAGFVFREPDKNHPKYKLAENLMKDTYFIDITSTEDSDVEEEK